MKKMQRITSTIGLILTISILLCFLSGCDLVIHPPEDGTVGADMGKPTEKVTEKLQKEYCTATVDEDFSPDKVIVELFPEYESVDYTVESFADVGCTKLYERWRADDDFIKSFVLTIDKDSKENVLEMIKVLEKRDDVYCAYPDYLVYLDAVPSGYDSDITLQWAIEKLQLPDAWDITTGSNTIYVGVIDSGIDVTHPDLVNNIDINLSECFSDDYDTALEDATGHGTHVAGIIGAQWNSDELYAVIGVCWNVKLVSLRVGTATGDFYGPAVAEAINYAERNGIQILNFSGGTYNESDGIKQALESYSGLFICSAGNDTLDTDEFTHYPSSYSYDNLISVGASTYYDNTWTSSNLKPNGYYEGSNYGATTVDLFAPGAAIYSCGNKTYNRYAYDSGTSMAAPFVTGVAALMMANNSNLSPARIKQLILDNVDEVSNFSGKCVSGGRLNAYKAVNASSHNCDYTYRYVSLSPSSHKAYCSCGYYDIKPHSNVQVGSVMRCSKCGYGLELWNVSIPMSRKDFESYEYR